MKLPTAFFSLISFFPPTYCYLLFFFFNDTATTEIYTLSLHDALPIFADGLTDRRQHADKGIAFDGKGGVDRKSTRLNSSHANISYAVFCLKKKKKRLFDARRKSSRSSKRVRKIRNLLVSFLLASEMNY